MMTELDAQAEANEAGERVRALVQREYGGTDVLRVETIAAPSPGPGEVLLDVQAAAIDRGTLHLLTGLPRMARLAVGLRQPKRLVPGLDVAGRVVAVGEGVTRLQVGQQVFGIARGSLTEQAVALETKLALAPAGLAPTECAVLGVSGLTALQALDAARVDAGDHVLVIGASGGVGSFAVKLAVARGARVTAVCSAVKAEAVRSWGADRVVDHAVGDPLAGLSCDAVIDVAGGTSLRRLRRVLTPTGTIVFVGVETGGGWTGGFVRPMFLALRMLAARQRYVMLMARETHVDLERIAEAVAVDGLRPHVHGTVPLEETPRALDELADGRVTGKVAVRVGGAQ
ncbi:NADPH:quinone reductase [Nocardioides daphniae]|uniref:NADPH:quinone reductase n=1 Tax=Nocardioides daphniae TaxID=402297 RepID=A0ABQ1Q2R4_9ACTN|nr:NADPH:quinone reductase [Nocardioides daphniae]